MPGMAGQSTPATTLLNRYDIRYRLHTYTQDSRASSYGAEAAEALGLPPQQMLKTLIAELDERLIVAVVPVSTQLDVRALAAAMGAKKCRMAPEADAERATGYVVGGISPLGHRKQLPVVIDVSVRDFDTVFCSAGRRGLQLELAPADLLRATKATVAPIATTSGQASTGDADRRVSRARPAGNFAGVATTRRPRVPAPQGRP